MAYRIVDREEWGAQYGDGDGQAQLPATEVYIHHSVTMAPDMVLPHDDDYEAIRRLDQIGADTFGEQYGISYTFCITPAGLIFEGHNVAKMGAHTKGHNSTARAICFVGNYEENELTEEQVQACAWLLQHGHAEGWWTQPRLTGGHRDVYSTACPGINAYNAIGRINELAAGGPLGEDELDMDRQTFEQQVHNGVLQALRNPAVRKELLGAVWHEAKVSREGNEIPALQELADAKSRAISAESQLKALAAAVESPNVSAEEMRQLVTDAVQQNIDITGTVNVSGSEEQS